MNRDALQSALSQDGGISARAALAELETGADFEVFLNRTASAQQLWRIWSCRYEIMLDTGVTPRPGLAETITKLQAAGAAPVYTWRPSLDRRGASSLSCRKTSPNVSPAGDYVIVLGPLSPESNGLTHDK